MHARVAHTRPIARCLLHRPARPPARHLPEEYVLWATITAPQEGLAPRATAQLAVRAGLRLHDRAAPLALMEQVGR